MSQVKHYRATLIEGAQNFTKYGKHKLGQVMRVSSAEPARLAYFQSSGRYAVQEIIAPRPKASAAEGGALAAQATVGRPTHSGPKPGIELSPQRLRSLAELPVAPKMSKKRLVNIARDLGCQVDSRKPPTNKGLVKLIMDRQAFVLDSLDAPPEENEDGDPIPVE